MPICGATPHCDAIEIAVQNKQCGQVRKTTSNGDAVEIAMQNKQCGQVRKTTSNGDAVEIAVQTNNAVKCEKQYLMAMP
ncbi:MAG: hypothetical protein IJ620_02400 [Bacteroidales bacterium]|nr:hypothetical protein [Bacteroidales bacterium]